MKEQIFQENEEDTQNQIKLQEPYKRDKYLGRPPRKILGTILVEDQRGTNGPENK